MKHIVPTIFIIACFLSLVYIPYLVIPFLVFVALLESPSQNSVKKEPATIEEQIEYEPIRWSNQFMSRADKQEYMKSPEWKQLKQQRLAIANHQCEVPGCDNTTHLDLHHSDYSRLGNEHIDDVRIVCNKDNNGCHHGIHEAASKLYSNGYGRENEYPLTLLSN